MFPAVLGVIGRMGVDPMVGARWLNALIFGANVALVGLLAYRITKSYWLGILGALVLSVSPVMLQVHTSVWSEPMYIFFGFLALGLITRYVRDPKGILVLAAGFAAGLAFLTRWTGAPLVGVCALAILLTSGTSFRKRLVMCGLFTALSCLPLGLWILRNAFTAGTAANRVVAFHPITTDLLMEAVYSVYGWFVPEPLWSVFRLRYFVVLLLSGCALGVVILRKYVTQAPAAEYPWKPPYVIFVFIGAYVAFVVTSISFFDASTPFDDRILSPVYVAELLLVLWLLRGCLWLGNGKAVVKVIVTAAGIFLAVSYVGRGTLWAVVRSKNGGGYTRRQWQESKLVQKVASLAPAATVYTNDPRPLYILTGKLVPSLPAKLDPTTGAAQNDFREEIGRVEKVLREKDGFLAYFRESAFPSIPSEEELLHLLPLEVVERYEDGTLYRLQAPNSPVHEDKGEQ